MRRERGVFGASVWRGLGVFRASVWRGLGAGVGLLLGGLLATGPAVGHPLGNFSVNRYAAIGVEPEAVEIRYVVDMAEIPTFQEIQDFGLATRRDHPATAAYLVRQAEALGRGLRLHVDGRPVAISVQAREVSFEPGAADLPTMRLDFVYRAPLRPAAAHRLSYRDENFAERIGWREVVVRTAKGVALVASSVPERDQSRQLRDYPAALLDNPPQVAEADILVERGAVASAGPAGAVPTGSRGPAPAGRTDSPSGASREALARPGGSAAPPASRPDRVLTAPESRPEPDFTAPPDRPAAGLTSPPSPQAAGLAPSPGRPESGLTDPPGGPATGLTDPPGRPAADPQTAAEATTSNAEAPRIAGSAGARQLAPRTALADLMTRRDMGTGVLLFALATAVVLGAFHALEPGHGKTVVAAYLVGSRGTAWHAVLLGLTVTVSHTAGVFVLGAVTLYASRYVTPERLYPWLGALSGLAIAGVGISLFRRRWQSGLHDHAHPHVHGGGHVHTLVHHGGHVHSHPHPEGHAHPHFHHDGHPHSHSHLGGHRTHAHRGQPPDAAGHAHPERTHSARSLLALGLSGGIVPCPGALVVLLSALAWRRLGLGILLVVAFSAGLAAVLIAIGILMVHARRLLGSVRGDGPLTTRWLPLASSLVMTLLGAVIIVQALAGAGVLGFRLG